MATNLGFKLCLFEGEKVEIHIGDLKKFQSEVYRAYGVFVVEKPAGVKSIANELAEESDDQLTESEHDECLISISKWTELTSASKNNEHIICRTSPKNLAGITAFPTPVKLFNETPYGVDIIIAAQIDSILQRRSLKKKSLEALAWISWNSKKDVTWATKTGKPPEAAIKDTPVKKNASPRKKK